MKLTSHQEWNLRARIYDYLADGDWTMGLVILLRDGNVEARLFSQEPQVKKAEYLLYIMAAIDYDAARQPFDRDGDGELTEEGLRELAEEWLGDNFEGVVAECNEDLTEKVDLVRRKNEPPPLKIYRPE